MAISLFFPQTSAAPALGRSAIYPTTQPSNYPTIQLTSMIRIQGSEFRDEFGRTLLLRGVNLGGSSKVPLTPDGATHRREGFLEHRAVSFVGRPFPLGDADEHFERLQRWGMTLVRLLVSWEAIEHSGPGRYDQAYLDYVRSIVRKAGDHGIYVLIDPHQDVWGRLCGGDGAPGWTLEAVGFDPTQFAATGAAIVHATHGDPFPRMIWPTNATKLAAATMFTLFFAGNDFAPETKIDGEPAQDYLQRHYVGAVKALAGCLSDLENVAGYDTMNEPSRGYIGWPDLNVRGSLKMGESPTPFQSMVLGDGFPQRVEIWGIRALGMRRLSSRILNPQGQRAWRKSSRCVWRAHGVWDRDAHGRPHLLQPEYFVEAHGRRADFGEDYLRPFLNRFAQAVRSVDTDAIIFVEPEPNEWPPSWSEADARQVVFAPHWYDGLTLIRKHYSPFLAYDQRAGSLVVGTPGRIRRSLAEQLAWLKRGGRDRLCGAPTIVGEFGIPFDLDDKRAFRTGDFSAQVRALDRSFQAIEANLLGALLWNYTADNSNARGDKWNVEDLSIYSRDQRSGAADRNSGGRALQAVVRPYPFATAGEPLVLSFDCSSRVFELEFKHDPAIDAPTHLFIPEFQYPDGYSVEISDGTYETRPADQLLVYRHTTQRIIHSIRITPAR